MKCTFFCPKMSKEEVGTIVTEMKGLFKFQYGLIFEVEGGCALDLTLRKDTSEDEKGTIARYLEEYDIVEKPPHELVPKK